MRYEDDIGMVDLIIPPPPLPILTIPAHCLFRIGVNARKQEGEEQANESALLTLRQHLFLPSKVSSLLKMSNIKFSQG